MKRNAVECCILAALMFLIPLFAMGGGAPAEGEEPPPQSLAPQPAAEDVPGDFRILDTSTCLLYTSGQPPQVRQQLFCFFQKYRQPPGLQKIQVPPHFLCR